MAYVDCYTNMKSKHLITRILFNEAFLFLLEGSNRLICPPGSENTILVIALTYNGMYNALHSTKYVTHGQYLYLDHQNHE